MVMTCYSTSNLKRRSLFKFEVVILRFVRLKNDYEDDTPGLLKATRYRFFVNDCMIIKWWCGLSIVMSLQWFKVIRSHVFCFLFCFLFWYLFSRQRTIRNSS